MRARGEHGGNEVRDVRNERAGLDDRRGVRSHDGAVDRVGSGGHAVHVDRAQGADDGDFGACAHRGGMSEDLGEERVRYTCERERCSEPRSRGAMFCTVDNAARRECLPA